MMICVIAPFFTSFILRTIAWRRSSPTKARCLDAELPARASRWAYHRDVDGRRRGLTYNFLPFMVLPIYASLERADPRIIEAGATSMPTASRPSAP